MLKTLKRSLKSLILAGGIIYGAILAPELHNHYLRHEVGESVVQVLSMSSDGGGTGFAIKGASGKDYIMTNRHVCGVQANGVIRVQVGEAEPIFRKVVYMDDIHDLCLIEGVDGLAPISLGSNQNAGDSIYVVGHPGLRMLTVSKGEYIGRRTIEMMYQVLRKEDCPGSVYPADAFYKFFTGKDFICTKHYESLTTTAVVYGGNSGSPVVNRLGNLVGVCFAGNTEQEHDTYMVPLRYVQFVLARF